MGKLTDTLSDPNYTPRIVDNGSGYSAIGALGNFGSNFLDSISQKQRRDAAGPKNDPALDEFASGMATILSGAPINPRATEMLKKFGKMETAYQNGNMEGTAYDLAAKAWLAEVGQRYPDSMDDILQLGAQMGFQHYYFREAEYANQESNNVQSAKMESDKKALEKAWQAGFDRTRPEGDAIAAGYSLLAEELKTQMTTAQLNNLMTQNNISEDFWKTQVESAQAELTSSTMKKVYQTLDAGMDQALSMNLASGDDPERQALFRENLVGAQLDIKRLRSDISRSLNEVRTVTDPQTGQTRVVPIPKDLYTQIETELKTQEDVISWLIEAPAEKQKAYIEATTRNAKIKAHEYMPTIMQMMDGTGMSLSGVLEFITTSPNPAFTSAVDQQALLNEVAAGMKQWSGNSFQTINKLTQEGRSPAIVGADPALVSKSFMQNANMAAESMKILNNPAAKTEDRKAAVKMFEDNMSSVVVSLKNRYNPSNINGENTKAGIDGIFNTRTLNMLDAYVAAGGDKDIAGMMGAQLSIVASRFIEAGKTDSANVFYNNLTGNFEVKPSYRALPPGPYGGYAAFARLNEKPTAQPADKTLAANLNNLLNFIDSTHTKYPVLKDEFLKESGKTVRDVAAMDGFEAYGKAISDKVAQQERVKVEEDQRFRQAAHEFDFYKDGSFGQQNTSEFHHSGTEITSMLDWIHQQEGSSYLEDDNGAGPAKFGILEKTLKKSKFSDVPIKDLTQEQADEIYQKEYIDPVLKAGVPPEAMAAVVDSAVNQGLTTALMMWKESNHDLEEFVRMRLRRYQGTKGWDQYGDVWTKRTLASAGLEFN